METYIFKNTGDFPIRFVVAPQDAVFILKPNEVFRWESDGIPPVLQKLCRAGDLDYWVLNTARDCHDWTKEGF